MGPFESDFRGGEVPPFLPMLDCSLGGGEILEGLSGWLASKVLGFCRCDTGL